MFQRSLSAALMRPLTRGERMAPESRATAERWVRPNSRLNALERLQIYNQQYWWRLLSSLRDDFPGLLAVLGERRFERLAVAYLSEVGSTSWNLRDLGQNLGAFIGTHPELVHPYETLAAEVCAVEWAQIIAFDGPGLPRLEPSRLLGNPARLIIRLQPHISLLELTHPVDRLLARLKQRSARNDSASNAARRSTTPRAVRLSVEAARKPIYLAVHRLEHSVYFKRLDGAAFRLLSAVRDGATLGTACAAAFQTDSGSASASAIQAWFEEWMQFGWLTR